MSIKNMIVGSLFVYHSKHALMVNFNTTAIKRPAIKKADRNIWWLFNPANMLGLKMKSQVKIEDRFY